MKYRQNIRNRAEVVEMIFWEYDAERHLQVEKQDSYEEGFQEGVESEKSNTLREAERADAEKNRADAAENRADAAEQELLKLKEELRRLQRELACGGHN